ncbi:hypothetical protein PsYK624_070980 [Phanerochaete sordida]|uniref:Uncharacterized protein n=1 Tax=Phanerochaete sordida TaxID=48140 RepID=A0A9P3G9U3_9APHY|nr:hypothetical protein PsYK624_070980 [Phanerochaete sordida]
MPRRAREAETCPTSARTARRGHSVTCVGDPRAQCGQNTGHTTTARSDHSARSRRVGRPSDGPLLRRTSCRSVSASVARTAPSHAAPGGVLEIPVLAAPGAADRQRGS